MKTLLYVVAGLAVLIVAIIGGSIAWVSNVKLDANDPNFAKKFRTMLEGNCVTRFKTEMAAKGDSPDYQQEALIKQVCACSAREITLVLARHKEMTPLQMEKAIVNNGPEILAAKRSCAESYGLKTSL